MDDLDRPAGQDQLTQRELEVLRLITDGLSNQAIAERLVITLGTVKWYVKQIYSKLGVSSRTQAVAAARTSGLLDGTASKVERAAEQHNLPYQPTPFIGRDKELTVIGRRLEDPACRLLTVVGPGGIGKTRLTLQAAEHQIAGFAQGVYFISLAPLSAPESIISAMAETIRFSFYPGPEPRQQLLDYLRAKQMLLVLDNFEHLLAGASLVADILETAPRVKILATSRERLNLQAETIFSLEGMAYPLQEFAEDAGEFSAVKLFLQSAAQVQTDFLMTADNLAVIAHICRQVRGMPLGLILAASWVEVLSVEEIAREIEESLNFLETEQRDLPERQRSLRAAFDHSWKLLTDKEREAFKTLSVFRGSFTREAAQQVAEAPLKALMKLVNKSLLRRDASTGRYEIHELLRQYGAEQLNTAPQESEHIHDLHCAYYSGYMQQQWTALMSLRQRAVLDEIGVEFNNILGAWTYAVEKRRASSLSNMALSLWYYCDLRMPRSQGGDIFRRAAEALQAISAGEESEIVLGHMLARQGWFADDPQKSLAFIEQSLVILRRHDCPEEMVIALDALALTAGFRLNRFAEGIRAAQESVRIARENHIEWVIGHSLAYLAISLRFQGKLIQARQIGDEGFRASEAIGDVLFMAGNAAYVLGPVAMDLGDYGEAERQFEQGLRWFYQVGNHWHVAYACSYLAKLALVTKDYEKAKYWLQQSLIYYQKDGRGWDRESYETLYDVGTLFAAQGSKEDAVELLSCLSLVQFQTQDRFVRDRAGASLIELHTALPEGIYAAAVERGKSLDFDTFIAAFLAS